MTKKALKFNKKIQMEKPFFVNFPIGIIMFYLFIFSDANSASKQYSCNTPKYVKTLACVHWAMDILNFILN